MDPKPFSYLLLCVLIIATWTQIYAIDFLENTGWNFMIADAGNGFSDYSAIDGSLLVNFDNNFLVQPSDIAEYNGTLYVTGSQMAINQYDRTTKEFLGFYKTFAYTTDAIEFFDIGGEVIVGVIGNGVISVLDFSSVTELFWYDCSSDSCLDLVQNPLNDNILVATSTKILQYSWSGSSLVLEGTYVTFADYPELGSSPGLARMHWNNSKLYVAFSGPKAIYEFNATSTSATMNGLFIGQPQPPDSNWELRDFAFLGDTKVAVAWNGYWDTGILRFYNTANQVWGTLAESNYTEGTLVGEVNRLLVSQGTLYVADYAWVSTWDSTSFESQGMIEHNQGYIRPQSIAYNPLGDPSIAYVRTANRILRVDRYTGKPIDTFIWKAIPGAPDGYPIFGRMDWHNNTLWVFGSWDIVAYDVDGQLIVGPMSSNDDMSCLKANPRDNKIYISMNNAFFLVVNVDTLQMTRLDVAQMAAHPSIAFSADGSIMYICADNDCTGINALDTITWEIVASSGSVVGGVVDIEVGPDGNVYLYSNNGILVLNGTADENQTLNALGILGSIPQKGGDTAFAPALPPRSKAKDKLAIIIGASVGGGVLLLGSFVIVALIIIRRKNKSDKDNKRNSLEAVELSEHLSPPASPGPIDSDLRTSQAVELANTMFHQFWEIDFDELEIESEIGRGAFGAVYKGEWRNSVCVIKQLQKGKITQEAITSFLKEASTVKTLRAHKNVCPIFGVCTNSEKPICIVMEYCNGGNLQVALMNKKIITTLPNLIKIFKDICSGMSHTHREGIIHCDLACRNCLVAFEGGSGEFSIKITDFGFARTLPKEGFLKLEQDIFPIRWTAPELMQENLATRACDVWSFGVVMWETIQGQNPYPNMSNTEVVEYVCEKHLHLDMPSRIESGQLPKSLYAIMEKCWERDPVKRISFDDLIQEFKKLETNTDLQTANDELEGTIDTPNLSHGLATDDKYARYSKMSRSGTTAGTTVLNYGNKSV